MKRRVVLAGLAGVVLAGANGVLAETAAPGAGPSEPGPRWAARAERELRLGRGLAPQLMTEEEWSMHQTRLQTMAGDDKERYRQEIRAEMLARAKKKGLTMPAGPRRPERQAPPS